MRVQRGSDALSEHGSDALSERDGGVYSTSNSDVRSDRNADVCSDSAADLNSEHTAIVIVPSNEHATGKLQWLMVLGHLVVWRRLVWDVELLL